VQNNPSINLATDKQVPVFDKFIDWTLTIGRLIVILTEIIAIVAFLYRFSLDDKLANLHSAIKQKQSIVFVLKNDETKYRNLQNRIATAANFSAKGIKTDQTITDIKNLIPNQVNLNSLIFNKDKINMKVDVPSSLLLSNFVNSLQSYPEISSISIDNIENVPAAGLSVDISTMLK